MPLGPSELILRSDQSIYHLALHPGDLADTVFLVGDPARVPLVSRHFDTVELTKTNREFVTHTGTLTGKRISVLSTGMGAGNIDIALNEIDALFNIDFETREIQKELRSIRLIRLGTSGGIQRDLPLDSIVRTDWAIGFDGLLNFYDQSAAARTNMISSTSVINAFNAHVEQAKWMPECYAFAGDSGLMKQYDDPDIASGITTTQPGFYAPQQRMLRLNPRNPNLMHALETFRFGESQILNMEMETACIYGMAHLLGHQPLSISAILANRITGAFSKNPEQTINRLIETALSKFAT
ncbi:uridine phosphorylase [Robiginitalea myxolifaciens]|uniref:Uridine phosphorylase n=1 Tax=Robiginitalea myxolifaciens TaxID=400055 RepID=A0A1I6GYS7_9FLAO|nr:nucleoside phosphorylase [Robiginitalea myxolifaciens]SFR47392.1 uridine phosphorylase [Robiginitalea myxolifaciens]